MMGGTIAGLCQFVFIMWYTRTRKWIDTCMSAVCCLCWANICNPPHTHTAGVTLDVVCHKDSTCTFSRTDILQQQRINLVPASTPRVFDFYRSYKCDWMLHKHSFSSGRSHIYNNLSLAMFFFSISKTNHRNLLTNSNIPSGMLLQVV